MKQRIFIAIYNFILAIMFMLGVNLQIYNTIIADISAFLCIIFGFAMLYYSQNSDKFRDNESNKNS